MWYSCLGTLLTVILGLLISLLTTDDSFTCCTGRSNIASEVPSTNNSNTSAKDSLQTVVVSSGDGTRSSKLSVGSMAPLALMMRTSVKLSPGGGSRTVKSREQLANDTSIGSSQASIFSIGQQTVTSELDGSYTEEDSRAELDRRDGSASGNGTIPTSMQSSMKVETERF
uniref:Uncharacterized protein n=1 Tax=Anopheles christyi TaxID=43041 RepID=A0A182K7L2_9DIPT